MASVSGVRTGNPPGTATGQPKRLGCCAKFWNFLVTIFCFCCPCLKQSLTIEDNTPRQRIQTRTAVPSGSGGQSLQRPKIEISGDTGLAPRTVKDLEREINQYINLQNTNTQYLINATLTRQNVESIFAINTDLTPREFIDRYILFLLLNKEHPDISALYCNPVISAAAQAPVKECLRNSSKRNRFYNDLVRLYPNIGGRSTQKERGAERRVTQSEDSSDSDVESFSNDLKNLVRDKLKARIYEDIRLSDEQLNYALDPSRTETLLICFDTERVANAFIVFLYLRKEYPQLNFDCFPCVGQDLLLPDKTGQYKNDADARRVFFDEQIKNNQTIMYLGGYRHEWLQHQRLKMSTLLVINGRCSRFNKEFRFNQPLFDLLISTLNDDDLNNLTPVELADQIECFVRLRNTRLPDDDELIEPHRFNAIRQLLPNYIENLRSRNDRMITFAYLEIKREFQVRNQNEAERSARTEEGRMNSLMAAFERNSDQLLVSGSIVQQEIAPFPEDLVRDRLIQEFQPYLQTYGFEEVDRERLIYLAGCLPPGKDNRYKVKCVVAFLLIQRESSDLTDEKFIQLNRDNVFKQLILQAPLQNKNLMVEIHFQRQLTREELQQCATVLLNHLNQPEAEADEWPGDTEVSGAIARPPPLVARAAPVVQRPEVSVQRISREARERKQREELNHLRDELSLEMGPWKQTIEREIVMFENLRRGGCPEVQDNIDVLRAEIRDGEKFHRDFIGLNERGRLPIPVESQNARVQANLIAGIQAKNNNCCFASIITVLNSKGILARLIELAQYNQNVSQELLSILRDLVMTSSDDFIHDRYLTRLRRLFNFPEGTERDLLEILEPLLDGLGFRDLWYNNGIAAASNSMSPIQYLEAHALLDPFDTDVDLRPKSIEDWINSSYRTNLAALPKPANESDSDWRARVRREEFRLNPNSVPELILMNYPMQMHGKDNIINNQVVLKDRDGNDVIYDVVSMASIKQSHFVSWDIDQEKNRVTFIDSMAGRCGTTTLPCTVKVDGLLADSERKGPLFNDQAQGFLQNYKRGGGEDYNMAEKFRGLRNDISLVVLKKRANNG